MKDNIINQLEEKNLSYNDLNKIQMFLVNNNYVPIRSIVFTKEELYDKDCVFYLDEKELWEYVEKGNGKIYDINRKYCQLFKDSINFYTFEKMKDIILNYTLYDCLIEENKKIINFLVKNFEIKLN